MWKLVRRSAVPVVMGFMIDAVRQQAQLDKKVAAAQPCGCIGDSSQRVVSPSGVAGRSGRGQRHANCRQPKAVSPFCSLQVLKFVQWPLTQVTVRRHISFESTSRPPMVLDAFVHSHLLTAVTPQRGAVVMPGCCHIVAKFGCVC